MQNTRNHGLRTVNQLITEELGQRKDSLPYTWADIIETGIEVLEEEEKQKAAPQ